MDARQLFEFARDTAKKTFDERGSHIPLFLLDTPAGIQVVGAPWGTDREKALAIENVREIAKAAGATRCVFVVEAWMSSDPSAPAPSKAADRKEIIWIALQSSVPGEQEITGHYRIERKANSRPRAVDFVRYDGGMTHGRFDGIVGGKVLH